MTHARKLLRCRHASRAGADHGDFLAGLVFGQLRRDPAFGPGAVDDGVFDGLDADRVVVHVQRAGGFARRRADAAGELGEVIGAVQGLDGVFPVLAKHHVIEVRNDVVDRAAAVAKRRAAVHAARSLLRGLLVVKADDKFFVVFQPLRHGLVALFKPFEFHETGDFSHDVRPQILFRGCALIRP